MTSVSRRGAALPVEPDITDNSPVPRLSSAASLVENRSAVLARVLDAWHDLLAERGYGAVTLAEVARRAGLSRSALYRYAPDKLTLFQLLIDREVDQFLSGLTAALDAAPSAAARLDLYVRSQLVYFAGQQVMGYDMSTVFTAEQHASVMVHLAPIRRRLFEILEEGIETGEFRPLDLDVTGSLVFAVLASHQMALARGDVTVEEIAEETVAFVMGAVVSR